MNSGDAVYALRAKIDDCRCMNLFYQGKNETILKKKFFTHLILLKY